MSNEVTTTKSRPVSTGVYPVRSKASNGVKIILVRHGQTLANVKKVFYGRDNQDPNTLLTETGKKQAKRLANDLKNEQIDLIICSPLIRTIETAKIINTKHNAKIKIDKRIADIKIDINYAGKDAQLYLDVLQKDFWHGRLGKSETSKELFKRIKNFIDDLKKYRNKNTILIVSHEDPIKIMKSIFEKRKYDFKYRSSNKVNNCQKNIYYLYIQHHFC